MLQYFTLPQTPPVKGGEDSKVALGRTFYSGIDHLTTISSPPLAGGAGRGGC